MRIYLDTNVFIAAFERKDSLSDLLGQMLASPKRSGSDFFLTSELTLSELLVVPLRQGNNDLVTGYSAALDSANGWLQVAPVDRNTLVRAAQLRASRQGLKLPDAIHLAAAAENGCSAFLTEDMDLLVMGTKALPTVRFLRPDEWTLNSLIESLRP